MFIDSGRIISLLGKEPPLMKVREEPKVDKARDEWKKLITQGWRRTQPVQKNPINQYYFQGQLFKLKLYIQAYLNFFFLKT